MGQMGFYDLDKRLEAISAKGDPLELIKATVPWESFRAEIEAVTRAKPEERKSAAGRKPYDAILMFKILVLQTLHNLADEQLEYLIRDRLSFMRFLDLGLEDPVPDATTVWLFREALAKLDWSPRCSCSSTSISRPRAISRVAVRSSMPRSCPRPSSTTAEVRMRRSRPARRRRAGRRSRPRMPRKTRMRAGPRSTTTASTATRTTWDRPHAQAHPSVRGDGRKRARQPEA
jgi:hypothetical protein